MHRNTIFAEKPAATGAYTGPGDIMPGAIFWTGLRGYSAAYSIGSNPGVDIVDQAGNNPVTINILADGTLDTATINAWVAANGVTTILISKLYDQTGNGNHFVQATNANRPTLTLNSIGTNNRPSIQRAANAASTDVFTVQSITQDQPYFTSTVCRCDSANGGYADTLNAGDNFQFGFTGADNVFIYLGSAVVSAAALHAVPHAVQYTVNGATSEIYVDGTGTTVNPGTLYLSGPVAIPGNSNDGENVSIGETGFWAGTPTSTQKSQMNANQHTWYGF